MSKKDMLGIAVRKLVTLPSETLGSVCDLLEKLSDPNWVKALKEFLRKENPWGIPTFPIWKTINIGAGLKNADDCRKALTDNDCRISDWASDILNQDAFTLAEEQTEINLVVLSVADLGFSNGATYADICQRAKEYGLELCPAEVGVQLRLQYKDQPKNEWLYIAMEPIADSGGRLRVFRVGHGDGSLWLDGDSGHPDDRWIADDRFVFASRK